MEDSHGSHDLHASEPLDVKVSPRRDSQQTKSSRFSAHSADKAPTKSFTESLSFRRSRSLRNLDVTASENGNSQPLDTNLVKHIDASLHELEQRLSSKLREVSAQLEGISANMSLNSSSISQPQCCENMLESSALQAKKCRSVPPIVRFRQFASIGGADLPLDDPIGQLATPHTGRSSLANPCSPTLLETARNTHLVYESKSRSPDAIQDATTSEPEDNSNTATGAMTVCIKPKPERGHLRKATSAMSSTSVGTMNTLNSSSASSRRSSGVSSLHLFLAQGPKELQRLRSRHFVTDLLWKFLNDSESSKLAHLYAVSMPMLIVGSTIFATIHFTSPTSLKNASLVQELAFDTLFSAEILARFVVCPSKQAFALSPYSYIDIFAGPLILLLRITTLFSLPELSDCLIGIVPVLRLLKVLRQFETFRLLLSAFQIAFEALPVLLFTLGIIVLVFSALIYFVEPRDNIPSLAWAIYLTIMTMTTVGYGDATPVSEAGQALACVLSISSTLYMAIPLGIVGNAFSHVWEDRDRLLLMSRTRDCLMQVGYTATSIPQLFLMYDSDRDGQLTLSEFRNMLQDMQIGIGEDRIFKLFQTFDSDASGAVDDREFVRELFPKSFAEIYGAAEMDGHTNENEV